VFALHKLAVFALHKLAVFAQGIFLFSYIWSVGSTTDGDGRAKFDHLMREIMDGPLSEETKASYHIINHVPPPSKSFSAPIPRNGDVFSWKFVNEGMGRYVVFLYLAA